MPVLSRSKIILILFALPILAILAFEIIYYNVAYPNTYIGNINIGGKNRFEIEALVKKEAESRTNKTITFSINKSTYITIKLTSDLLTYDIKKTTDDALRFGKTGSIVDQLKQHLSLITTKQSIRPTYTFDNFTFDTMLADGVRTYEKPVIESQLVYTDSGPVMSPSKPGVVANRDQAMAEVTKFLDFDTTSSIIEVALETKNPQITRENSQEILDQAKRAVSRSVTLYSDQIQDKTWTLDAPDLFSFLEVKFDDATQKPKLTIADYKVASYSAQFAPRIKKEAKDPKYETVGNQMVITEPAQNGQELDSEKLTSLLAEQIFSGGQNNRIAIPIKEVKPALALANGNEYGIKEIIGTGTSEFKGSSEARIHNIEVAAQKLNGTLIKPGQVFSMYNTVGNIEKSTGFEDSYIIKNGRTVVGVGGGVCQVSTTVFRAALNAGFKINERHPHSYRVKYYEQDSQPGFDAAIFFPQADLKFTNNTDKYVLIQTKLDRSNQKLTLNFYGTSDGRTVEIGSANTTNIISPPKDARINDPTIPKGITRQTEFAAQGSDISFNRVVKKNGTEIINETFKSHYYPWQAIFLIGTKEN